MVVIGRFTIYNKFGSLESVNDSLGTRDWPVRLGFDLTYPNIMAKPKVIIGQVTSLSDLSLLRLRYVRLTFRTRE